MEALDVFDPKETRAGGHRVAWEALDEIHREIITLFQTILQRAVDQYNPGQFKPTSGWRSVTVNSAVGGVDRSLHLVGLARDFVRVTGSPGKPPLVPSSWFKVIVEDGWFHVQITARCVGG